MIPGHPYIAMLVTGILHAILGFVGLIMASVGLSGSDVTTYFFINKHFETLYGVAILCSLWILFIGALGISAGMSRLDDKSIRALKITYMVTAILSACIFSLVGLGMFARASPLGFYGNKYYGIHVGGSVVMAMEFVLAIVSSSICCCCSSPPTTMVVIQAPPIQTIQNVQPPAYSYQTPGMQTFSGVQIQTPGVHTFSGVQYQPPFVQTLPGVQYQHPAYPHQQPDMKTYPEVRHQPPGVQTGFTNQNQAEGTPSEINVTK